MIWTTFPAFGYLEKQAPIEDRDENILLTQYFKKSTYGWFGHRHLDSSLMLLIHFDDIGLTPVVGISKNKTNRIDRIQFSKSPELSETWIMN